MARSVADLRLLFGAMAGRAPDQLGAARPVDGGADVSLANLRIALIDSMPELDVDPDVVENLHRAARRAEAEGASVEPVPFPWSYGRLFDTVKFVYAQSYGPQVRQVIDDGGAVTDYAQAFSASLAHLTGDYRVNLRAMAETAELHREFARLFARFDVLLLPTLAAPAYPLGDHFIDHGPTVCGREQPDRWIVGFTVAFNIASACPVVTIPTGLSGNHIPTGMQIVARPYHDGSAISVAAQFERLIGV
jgi:Asp-tRNA(Asn)/Glu-tRNA(Gln) amidotransferase A subunit family amidase